MDIFETIRSRRAVHNFLPNMELSDAQLLELFDYVRLTPSGYNVQPWEFVVIRDEERKKCLAEIAFGQDFILNAAACIVVLGDTDIAKRSEQTAKVWLDAGYLDEEGAMKLAHAVAKSRSEEKLREMAIRNVGLVSMTLMLAAEGMGLATCPMMGFSKWKMSKFLDLPSHLLPGMLIAVGYKDQSVDDKPRLSRRSLEELVHFEKLN